MLQCSISPNNDDDNDDDDDNNDKIYYMGIALNANVSVGIFFFFYLHSIAPSQDKIYMGSPGDFAPEMHKRALENQKRAPENCHRLQCKSLFNVADLVNGMWKVAPENINFNVGLPPVHIHNFQIALTVHISNFFFYNLLVFVHFYFPFQRPGRQRKLDWNQPLLYDRETNPLLMRKGQILTA